MSHYRKDIKKIADEWTYKLGLEPWAITIHLVKEIHNNEKIAGICDAEWKYEKATILLKKSEVKSLTYKQLERLILHEMVHCLTDEMRHFSTDPDHEERVVTNLTNALIWTKKGVIK